MFQTKNVDQTPAEGPERNEGGFDNLERIHSKLWGTQTHNVCVHICQNLSIDITFYYR